MELLTTAEAAERAGVTVRQWHYWTGKEGLEPTKQLKGVRGVMLWRIADVRKVTRLASEAAA